jgi:hypothetical protein
MRHEFGYSVRLKLDLKTNGTYVGLEIPLLRGLQDFQGIDWQKYFQDCRKSLHAFARQQGLEILVWSVDFDEQHTSVSHYVVVRGVLFGTVQLHLSRTLRPFRGYRM